MAVARCLLFLGIGSAGVVSGSEQPSALVRGLTGGAAYGLTVAAVSHPFDTIKARLQVGAAPLTGGLRGLYRGVGAATMASVLFRTIPFIGYEAVTSALRGSLLDETAPLAVAFLGGAVGGVLRGCAETPAELIKTRQQLGLAWSGSSLLLGLRSTCLRNAWVVGLYWVIFEASKPARVGLPPMLNNFVAGGLCSVGAWAVIYPLDTVKQRIQSGHAGPGAASVSRELGVIYRQSGVRGLYRGIGSGLTRVLLANGLGMVAYGLVTERMSRPRVAASAAR